jgi:serine/threonine-protein kinase
METINDATVTPNGANKSPPAALPELEGYEVLALVGRGGMGRVYRARQLGLGRIVAVKLLLHVVDERVLARFRAEASIVARLQHPNIAHLYETGAADGQPYYTQEFLEGGSLAQALNRRPQEPQAAAATVEIIARAIQYSHDHGVLHRDLKPANILLTKDGVPKVTDFGLAKIVSGDEESNTKDAAHGLTRTGDILGTPGYMPPEQATGELAAIGPASDVYGLGAILYEMLTGRAPFQGPDAMQTLMMVLSMEPVPPSALQPKVPKDLETICLKCLEKEPNGRYPSAQALGDDLKRFLSGEPIQARPVGYVEWALKWVRRRKAAAALLVVSFAALVMLSASALALAVGYVKLQAALGETRTANEELTTKNVQLEEANSSTKVAKEETQRTLDLTLTSLDRFFFDFSDQLKTMPGGTVIRREILDEARTMLDGLGRMHPHDPVIRKYRANGYFKLGGAEDALGRHRQAAQALQQSRQIYMELLGDFPDDANHRQHYALTSLLLANKYIQLNELSNGQALRQEAFRMADELLAAHPNDTSALRLAEEVEFNRYAIALNEGFRAAPGSPELNARDAEAEQALRRCIEHCRTLISLNPNDSYLPLNLVDRELTLSGFLNSLGRFAEAEKLILSARGKILEQMGDKPSVKVRVLAATIWFNLGYLHNSRDRYFESASDYRSMANAYQELARDFPNNPLYRHQAARAWLYVGQMEEPPARLSVLLTLTGDAWLTAEAAAMHIALVQDLRDSYSKSHELLVKLLSNDPKNLQYQDTLKVLSGQMNAFGPTMDQKR